MTRPTKSAARAMTPVEAVSAFNAFARTISSRATAYVTLNTERGYGRDPKDPALDVSVYENGFAGNRLFTITANTFEDALAATSAKWEELKDAARVATITRMALAIIKLTDAKGVCTDAMLRNEGFACEDVRSYSAVAIDRANEMAGRGPFTVQFGEKSNGAPATVERDANGDDKPFA